MIQFIESSLLLVSLIVLINTCSLMLSCSVFSRVCLCIVFLCVRERPPLWRGVVATSTKFSISGNLRVFRGKTDALKVRF